MTTAHEKSKAPTNDEFHCVLAAVGYLCCVVSELLDDVPARDDQAETLAQLKDILDTLSQVSERLLPGGMHG